MLRLVFVAPTGGTFFATIERLSDGFFWDETAQAFAAAPALVDKKLPLTEGVGENLESYRRDQAGLGSPREVLVRIHDDADPSDKTVSATKTFVVQGLEQPSGDLLGPGAIEFTFTSLVGAVPLSDVDVWVSTDAAGTNVIASGRTDASGDVVFYLDAGDVFIFQQKSGFNFSPNPVEVTVS